MCPTRLLEPSSERNVSDDDFDRHERRRPFRAYINSEDSNDSQFVESPAEMGIDAEQQPNIPD
ncbi:hypothetical protein RRF57_002577 [Xylaria bambusicola]|uniref:Uncharacterized protein n=1 Tax=Xylaria bambusicola TaxID=326684 RepID=A0AAN7UFH5_9PEZI